VVPNDSWVLTPEGISGPYVYPPSQTLRQVKTENQPVIPLWLDIGIIEMAICEPLNDAPVDIWHFNATGSYSSFTGLPPNISFPQLLQELNISNSQMGLLIFIPIALPGCEPFGPLIATELWR
jgi:protocatechuate 3,4-dioxygenase beta subunit